MAPIPAQLHLVLCVSSAKRRGLDRLIATAEERISQRIVRAPAG